MRISLKGIAEIAGHEGIVLNPYKDSVGVYTVGIGHTAAAGEPDPAKMSRTYVLPIREVIELFDRDLRKYGEAVARAVKVPLEQHEFDALVSFHFNTGAIARATLTKKLNAGDREGAIAEFDRWHKPPEIAGRRDKEKRLFATGVYSNAGMATVYTADERGRVLWDKGQRMNILAMLGQPGPPVVPAGWQPDDPGPVPAPAPSSATTGFLGLLRAILEWLGRVLSWQAGRYSG